MLRLTALMLICALPASALSKHAALSDTLVHGKTIYIDNETGAQEVPDSASDLFAKSGRFIVSNKRDGADLVATFKKLSELKEGTTVERVELVVTANQADPDAALYQDTELSYGLHTERGRLGASAGKCVDRLLKRLAK